MLSVLIPVYNYDVRELVREIHRQCSETGIPFEIRCLDDGSSSAIRAINNELRNGELPEVICEELDKNTGRTAIRNELARRARYPWLWFLDCDGDARVNPRLAKTFLEQKTEDTLLSGGRVYQPHRPENRALLLHWLWGSKRELLDPAARMRDPVNNFLSNNFVVHRQLFETVSFDERLSGYGYEDTFFAAGLVKAGFHIRHINNPVLHAGLEPAGIFLKKIRESLDNLELLKRICREKNMLFPVKSRLTKASTFLSFPLLRPLVAPFFRIRYRAWEQKLLGTNPGLLTFDLYRLAYLLLEKRKERRK